MQGPFIAPSFKSLAGESLLEVTASIVEALY
jgi:hypothetical protein